MHITLSPQVVEEDPSIECPPGLNLPDNFEDGHGVDLIRRCLLNEGFDTIQEYDVYRYACTCTTCMAMVMHEISMEWLQGGWVLLGLVRALI